MKHLNVVISNDIPGELSNNVSCGSTACQPIMYEVKKKCDY